MAGEEPAGLPVGGMPGGIVGNAPSGILDVAPVSSVDVEFGVLLSAVMAVSVGSADDDPL